MNEKIDALVAKLTDTVDQFLEEVQTNPVRTAIKVLVILWVIKQARRLIKDLR